MARALALALVTLVVFAPALANDFVEWDDDYNFLFNPHYRGLGWAQVRWMFSPASVISLHWIPVSWLTLGLDYTLWGMNPLGYHLTSILFHAANAALFYLLALRLLHGALPTTTASHVRLGAAFAALFFALHPLRAESVAWVTERRDVVSLLFYLLTLLAYLRYAEGPDPARARPWLLASIACYAVGLLAKSSFLALPAVLLVLDVYPLRRRPRVLEKLPYLLFALLVAAVTIVTVTPDVRFAPIDKYPLLARAEVAAYGTVFYLWETLLPVALSPLHEFPARIDVLAPRFMGSAVLVLLLTVVLVVRRKSWPAALAVWIAYALALVPVSGIVQAGVHLVADRYCYLPALGPSLLLGGGLACVARMGAEGRLGVILTRVTLTLAVAWLAVLSLLTWGQVQVWKNTDALWEHAVDATPDCAMCHARWGMQLVKRDRIDAALAHFRRAVELRPDLGRYQVNIGIALHRAGRPADALVFFERALRDDPRDVHVATDVGLTLLDLGRPAEATRFFQRALAVDPRAPLPRFGLARAYLALGLPEAAAAQTEILRSIDPRLAADAERR